MNDSNDDLKYELEKVCILLDVYLADSDILIKEPIRHTINSNGKLLRPSLLLRAAHCGTYNQDSAIAAAVAIELLHIASLIHDDIVDEGKIRRGTESVQSRLGKDLAEYAGDYLIMQSFSILKTINEFEIINLYVEATANICRGEIKQQRSRYRPLSTEEYIQIISKKTGALFGLSIETGAYLAGMKAEIRTILKEIGIKFGIACQIYDDCLDYTSNNKNASKEIKKELRQGFYTLPLLCAMENDGKKQLKRELDNPINNDSMHVIYGLVKDLKGLDSAQKYMKKYLQQIEAELQKIPYHSRMSTLYDFFNSTSSLFGCNLP